MVLSQVMVMPTLEAVGSTLGWTAIALVLFYTSLKVFDWIDPIDYRREIENGNVAAGIVLAAFLIAMAAIITAAIVS